MEQQYTFIKFTTTRELYQQAANLVVKLANEAVARKGHFDWALSGGHTPNKLYRLLSKKNYIEKMPWSSTYIFWGDERCVAPESDENNAHMAKQILLDSVPIPADHIFRISVDVSPYKSAEDYETKLRNHFGNTPDFDLLLLGLGTNGHTASIFPGTAAVNEKAKWVMPVYIEKNNMYRITLTPPVINASRQILFLVTGNEKREILHKLLNPQIGEDEVPAKVIDSSKTMIYADEAAAGDQNQSKVQ